MDPRIDPGTAADIGLTTPENFASQVASGRLVGKLLGLTPHSEIVLGDFGEPILPPPDINSKDGVGFLRDPGVAGKFAAAWRASQTGRR